MKIISSSFNFNHILNLQQIQHTVSIFIALIDRTVAQEQRGSKTYDGRKVIRREEISSIERNQ